MQAKVLGDGLDGTQTDGGAQELAFVDAEPVGHRIAVPRAADPRLQSRAARQHCPGLDGGEGRLRRTIGRLPRGKEEGERHGG